MGTQHKDKGGIGDYLGCFIYRYKLKGLSKREWVIDDECEEKMELEA